MFDIPQFTQRVKEIAHTAGEERIRQFQQLKAQSTQHFNLLLNEKIFITRNEILGTLTHCNALTYAILHGNNDGLIEFVDLLIQSGVNINDTMSIIQYEDGTKDQLKLTHICAQAGNLAILTHLTEKNAISLTTLTDQGRSLFSFIPSDSQQWLNFMSFLESRDALETLCSINQNSPFNVFNILLGNPEIEGLIVKTLYQAYPAAYQKSFIEEFSLMRLANLSLSDTAFYELFQNASTLSQFTTQKNAANDSLCVKIKSQFENGERFFYVLECMPESADSDMTYAIHDYVNNILRNATSMRMLLSIIETELEKELNKLGIIERFRNASCDYKILNINHYHYPIPTDRYQPLSKQSALERALLNILRKEGMGLRARKWYGLVAYEKANKMISDGDFFIESQFGTGVLHGKFSHMIQWALLILGIRHGLIRSQPGITAKSIISYLVTHKNTQHDEFYLAEVINDVQYPGEFTFQDPFRLCSSITTGYFGEDCRLLEIYLRDAFCSGYQQWLAAYNAALPSPLSSVQFATLLNHSSTNSFNTAKFLTEAYLNHINKSKGAGRTYKIGFFSELNTTGSPYALIEKDYFINKKHK